ncbi:MAG: hypothetical protein HQL88_04450 [Magnetococcales bacterium]|nr:hypothetical protein [Magnetococcales bacterium]
MNEAEGSQALLAQLEAARERAEALRRVLLSVPHGTGDHTDLCRMHNEGISPRDEQQCRCHVGRICAALRQWR